MSVAWMAWTWQTAIFFAVIGCLLAVMTVLAILRPETERVGILGIPTTRGDRLFVRSSARLSFISPGWGSSAQACGGLSACRFSTRQPCSASSRARPQQTLRPDRRRGTRPMQRRSITTGRKMRWHRHHRA